MKIISKPSLYISLLLGLAGLLIYHFKGSHNEQSMVGVYWGAFDPPTEAHFAIISAALKDIHLEKLLVIVNNHSYKTYTYPLESRRQMITHNLSPHELEKVEILWQDDEYKLDYASLKKLVPEIPLCAISGYDAYKKWLEYSKPEDRTLYHAIAVVPRGEEAPLLFDEHAFLLTIDEIYKHVSSTQVRNSSSDLQIYK